MSDNDLIHKGQNDLIRRGDALALPPYDSDGDSAGRWDHHIFVRIDAIAALTAVTDIATWNAAIRAAADKFRSKVEYLLLSGDIDDIEADILAMLKPETNKGN